jgi:hypothetical protein
MHPLAKALRDAGATVYVPVVRGHGFSVPVGDIGYIGQLEHDLADFVRYSPNCVERTVVARVAMCQLRKLRPAVATADRPWHG